MFEQAQRRVLRFVGQSLLVLAALALVLLYIGGATGVSNALAATIGV